MKILHIILFSYIFGISSDIQGVYSGKSLMGSIIEKKKNGKHKKDRVLYNNHNLTLKKDSTFSYKFEKNTILSQISNTKERNCSGKYKIKNDTLILNSNNKGIDFFIIKEKVNNQLPVNTIQISIKNQDKYTVWGQLAEISVENKSIKQCFNKDTIYIKHEEAKPIKINILPINFEYEFEPKNNEIEILFKTQLNNENFYLENWKFLIVGNQLLPINKTNGLLNGLIK